MLWKCWKFLNKKPPRSDSWRSIGDCWERISCPYDQENVLWFAKRLRPYNHFCTFKV